MKQQIKRLSPHQNGKVFGVLMALTSLVFVVPMFLLMSAVPHMDRHGNPVDFPTALFLLVPLGYLLFGYVSVVIWCWIYNALAGIIGGIEFELEDQSE